MSRMPFNSPLILGFERFEEAVDRVRRTSGDGYPPYNVLRVDEDCLRITLAVAGFSADELQLQMEDDQLVIRGKQSEERDETVFLHRGIAARQFVRTFVLAQGIEVSGARLENGLLHIDLTRPPETARVRKIEIEAG